MGRWPEHVEPFGLIGDRDAVDRLMQQVERRSRHVYGDTVQPPSVAQVGMVLRALADHTANRQAVTYAPDPSWRDPADSTATSVGRWFHRYADACEARAQGWTTGEYPRPEDPPRPTEETTHG